MIIQRIVDSHYRYFILPNTYNINYSSLILRIVIIIDVWWTSIIVLSFFPNVSSMTFTWSHASYVVTFDTILCSLSLYHSSILLIILRIHSCDPWSPRSSRHQSLSSFASMWSIIRPRHLHVRFFISLFFMIFFISLVSIIFRCYDSLKRIFLVDAYLRNTHNWILTNNPSNRRIIHLSMKHKKPVRMIILCDVSVSIMFLIFGDLKSL